MAGRRWDCCARSCCSWTAIPRPTSASRPRSTAPARPPSAPGAGSPSARSTSAATTPPRAAPLAAPRPRAFLTLVVLTGEAAPRHGKGVGVCGGLAAEPLAVPVLLGIGVDELSVPVPAIAAVKALVRRLSLRHCRDLARDEAGLRTARRERAAHRCPPVPHVPRAPPEGGAATKRPDRRRRSARHAVARPEPHRV